MHPSLDLCVCVCVCVGGGVGGGRGAHRYILLLLEYAKQVHSPADQRGLPWQPSIETPAGMLWWGGNCGRSGQKTILACHCETGGQGSTPHIVSSSRGEGLRKIYKFYVTNPI